MQWKPPNAEIDNKHMVEMAQWRHENTEVLIIWLVHDSVQYFNIEIKVNIKANLASWAAALGERPAILVVHPSLRAGLALWHCASIGPLRAPDLRGKVAHVPRAVNIAVHKRKHSNAVAANSEPTINPHPQLAQHINEKQKSCPVNVTEPYASHA